MRALLGARDLEELPIQTVTTIGLDIAKSVFQVHGIDAAGMRQHGLLRSLKAAELSDGTLRYLLLISALLSPRPPTLMILNEPETSLHQDLFAPLARLVAGAASRSQIFVVTHASPLPDSLLAEADCRLFVLGKELGETVIADVERPTWTWPKR
jgi:predicted ATPase